MKQYWKKFLYNILLKWEEWKKWKNTSIDEYMKNIISKTNITNQDIQDIPKYNDIINKFDDKEK